MKNRHYAAMVAMVAWGGVFGERASAQANSSSSACLSVLGNNCQTNDSPNSTTSSAAQNGTSSGDAASAFTGIAITHPVPGNPGFSATTGISGIAASATPGQDASARANWTDTWSCSNCTGAPGQTGAFPFKWTLHLTGVLDPILIAPPSTSAEPSFVALHVTYGDGSQGYQLVFDICYDSGPCSTQFSSLSATLRTPAGTQDLTSSLVFGTNSSGLPTVSLDVDVGFGACSGPWQSCTWADVYSASADVENSGTTTHFLNFSGTFDAAVVSLIPGVTWTSAGGRTAPPSPALVTYTGQYLAPLSQSADQTNPAINTIHNGRVLPVKVQLSKSDGTVITDGNAPGPITIGVTGPFACDNVAGGGTAVFADAGQSNGGTNQFRFDPGEQIWIYNLETKGLGLVSGNCYRIDTTVNGTAVNNAFVVIRPTG